MLRKLGCLIKYLALKVKWFKEDVDSYLIEKEKKRIQEQIERHHKRWEYIMRGQAVRDAETEKPTEFSRFDCVNWGTK